MKTSQEIIEKLNTRQLKIFAELLRARLDNKLNTIYEIIKGTSDEDCAAISECLRELEELREDAAV